MQDKKQVAFYIGFYALEPDINKRFCNIAAIKKMDYTLNVLSTLGYNVELISLSWVSAPFSFSISKRILIGSKAFLSLPPGIFVRGKLFLKINIVIAEIWFIIKCLKLIPKYSKVIVYHSPNLLTVLKVLKWFKSISIIMEIGEIYSEVWPMSKREMQKEKKILELCDNFIPASTELYHQLGKRARFILHGSYQLNTTRDKINYINENIYRIVYAGSIDKTKSGAYTAIEIMRYLPDNYHLHIAGYGVEKEIILLKKMIEEINKSRSHPIITFEGMLNQHRLDSLLKICDIAINPQKPGAYMRTAFPSKILVYLSYMLNVVSTTIESVEDSKVAQLVTFVKGNAPEDFAKMILNIDWEKVKSIPNILGDLDVEYRNNLLKLLNN